MKKFLGWILDHESSHYIASYVFWGVFLLQMFGLIRVIDPTKKLDGLIKIGIIAMMALTAFFVELYTKRSTDEQRELVLEHAKDLGERRIQLQKLWDTIRETLKKNDMGLDETLIGSFVYGKEKMLTEESSIVVITPDFEDREFDCFFLVKRKSMPVDEFLHELHKDRLI